MKQLSFLFIPLMITAGSAFQQADAKKQVYSLSSPGNVNTITITAGDTLKYSVESKDGKVVDNVTIAMLTDKGEWGVKPHISKARRSAVNETFSPVVPLKHSTITDNCNVLTLSTPDGYAVEFRAYDNGVAHRFVGTREGTIDVTNEIYDVTITPSSIAHIQPTGSFRTSYENPYTHIPLSDWTTDKEMATLPVLIEESKKNYILLSESDLIDYPAMFMKGNGDGSFSAIFPPEPLKWEDSSDRSVRFLEEAPYIARTDAKRSFPWRFMAIGTPADIVEQTFEAQLSGRNTLADTSWIKPGTVSWEWWNGAMPYGDDVNFESGYNLDTYKYFIDFASKYGINYIIMDEGWANDTRDPFTPNPNVNVHELIKYGNEKGVGIILWLPWLTVEKNFDLFKTFSDWGVKGIKIDFMDRSDQWMVNFYERVMKEAAENNLLIDMHGAFKPAGLEQRYPNLLSYEGVLGMEQMGGCRPDNSLYLPFIRNAVGPMDYTPGAMISMQPECYRSARPNSASIGTRAYQMALFVVFESGIQMLADNPTMYYRNPECTEFIASVPVTWDETKVLEAVPGEYIIVAKRKGNDWYIGAITNNAMKHREFNINLDFLEGNHEYSMISFEDGVNAHHQAMDYRRKESKVNSNTIVPVKLARNGGWTAVIKH